MTNTLATILRRGSRFRHFLPSAPHSASASPPLNPLSSRVLPPPPPSHSVLHSIAGQPLPVFGTSCMVLRRFFANSATSGGDRSPATETEETSVLRTSMFRTFMSSVSTAPVLPMVLGVAGAVPFLVLTPPFPYILPLPEVLSANLMEAQSFYGAVILSFLGGPHWGLAMVGINASPNHKIFNYASNSLRYVWSVMPSLLAWPALLMPMVPRLQFLICSFGVAFVVDVLFASRGLTPPWYLPLRLLLTGIVILCLTTSLIELLIAEKIETKKDKK